MIGYRATAGVARALARRADEGLRGVGTLLRLWPLWKPFGLRLHVPEDDYAHMVDVGDCDVCGGVIFYSDRARLGSCADGCTMVGRAELLDSGRIAR